MRTYTLAFSIVAHLAIVAGLIVAPLVATDVLPEPRRAVEWILVTAPAMPAIPPPAPPMSATRTAPAMSSAGAPIDAPEGVAPETGFESFESNASMDGVPDGVSNGIVGSLVIGDPLPPPVAVQPPRPVRVGGAIREPRKIHDVRPVYPALALAARVQGIVILEAEIGEDGSVRNVRVLRSQPLLDQAAVDAVRQWLFTPTLLNGEAVPVVMTVTVAFTLERR